MQIEKTVSHLRLIVERAVLASALGYYSANSVTWVDRYINGTAWKTIATVITIVALTQFSGSLIDRLAKGKGDS